MDLDLSLIEGYRARLDYYELTLRVIIKMGESATDPVAKEMAAQAQRSMDMINSPTPPT